MQFLAVQPSAEDYWRAIVLFGLNVASFKFALAESLLELGDGQVEYVSLEALAAPFVRHVCRHLQMADKQGTSPRSRFLDACRAFNRGEMTVDRLQAITTKRGFVNVIDAFHNLPGGNVPVKFFIDERTTLGKGIRLTEDLYRLRGEAQAQNLPQEVEARWRLVETAWGLNLPRHVLTVSYDSGTEVIHAAGGMARRKAIAPVRDSLNGYQKGRCFYCFAPISVVAGSGDLADVDHFFPYLLKSRLTGLTIDGVWNLVLACIRCNRGPRGKFAALPAFPLLDRLRARNECLIGSHHPLRETLMAHTGMTRLRRRRFLQAAYNEAARSSGFGGWTPDEVIGLSF